MPNLIQSLERALQVLEFLNTHDGARIGRIAAGAGITHGTAYRILLTLAEHKYIVKDAATGQHWLEPRVQRLSMGYESERWVADVARPLLAKQSAALMWPLAVFTPLGTHLVCRATTDYASPVAAERWPAGSPADFLKTAAGRVYLAFCPAEQLQQILTVLRSQPGRSASPRGAGLTALLARIRARGFETFSVNATYSSAAVPILIDGMPFGSLNMRFFKSALRPAALAQEMIPRLQGVAAALAAGIVRHRRREKRAGSPGYRNAISAASPRAKPRARG